MGIATAALSQLLDLLDMRPPFAHVARHNIGSIPVLEKCGFTPFEDGEEPAHAPADGLEELTLKLGRRSTRPPVGHRSTGGSAIIGALSFVAVGGEEDSCLHST
jgi:hypothetical protein